VASRGRGDDGSRALTYDVAIVGAGVVGAAIARELAQYDVSCVLLDAADDVGTGTSKANTAILHTGFDATPGSLEARLVRRGHALLMEHGPRLGIPIEKTGALLVAWTDEQRDALAGIAAKAAQNGYGATRPVAVGELYALEPHLGPGATGALAVPDEHVVCPFTTPLAFATEAVVNGVTLSLGTRLDGVRSTGGIHVLATSTAAIEARWVVNAAGLQSDVVDRLFGHTRFTVTPRRGELIVFDKLARPLVGCTILPVPTATTKGVLVAPTVFGNVVLGPTAEDVPDRSTTGTTAAGLASLLAKGERIVPALLREEVTATYTGLRAATEHCDYSVFVHPDARYVCAGGIRSTGLTASMAIAEHVVDGMRDGGLALERRTAFRPIRMPNLGDALPRPYCDPARIAGDPEYGRIVCHCERVTRGEIRDATTSPIPPRSLDALRRRTRAGLGRCQGFYCLAEVVRLLADASGRDVEALLGMPAS
jgi:glycerol-3-phosphate dehydrogenase